MLNFSIKTHRKDNLYTKPHLFLLNKGWNSGKPQKVPFTNCFVIIFDNEKDTETIYWTAYGLWKAKYWHQLLCGSVIPFLRLNDLKKEFTKQMNYEIQEYEQHLKDVEALKLLMKKEEQFNQNLSLISDMKRAILYRYYKR